METVKYEDFVSAYMTVCRVIVENSDKKIRGKSFLTAVKQTAAERYQELFFADSEFAALAVRLWEETLAVMKSKKINSLSQYAAVEAWDYCKGRIEK